MESKWIAAAAAALAFASTTASADEGRRHQHAPHRVAVAPAPVVVPAPVRTWVPAHWEARGRGQVWVQGHWVVHHPVHAAPVRHVRHDRSARWDQDRDGIADRHDRDRDGDGVPNRHDRAPTDPRWR